MAVRQLGQRRACCRTPSADREARLLIFTGRTGRWKGIFSVHSWVVYKPEGATAWSRYDVVGWGNPVRMNGWAPDGRWYGDVPRVLVDVKGAAAQALIPKIRSAIEDYRYRNNGDYRMWPGPNSNTFIAAVLRAVPELATTLPPNAVGKDFRDGFYAGLTDSRTGVEVSLFGLLGIKAGWVEGIELNMLGLVAGLDLRHPAVKLPGFGRIGIDERNRDRRACSPRASWRRFQRFTSDCARRPQAATATAGMPLD